ncbi:HNH endonuclease signature motif containing protein [Mycolicibacterium baixiangningiae]|uniref:HNH endonuclease signature motif containing protein n=1 Tax=Mycolicibacterium baixiangningiae TaxID=2761578 RepID=UPI001D005549|nr:HNH endonuclease signature motif containing protein [Mycolicibacterium baixiangningiae]
MIESMFDGSLPEIADFSALSDAELILATGSWARVESAAAARRLAAMAEMFRRRTGLDAAVDRHNWFVDPEASAISEVAAAQNITESLAMFQTHRAVMLNDRLPKVAALFAQGLINDLLVRAVVTRTALITDPDLRAAVDTDLAAHILHWGPKSANKTREAIDAIVETHDPGALRRTRNAEQDRDVEFGFMGDEAGYMTLWARMYAPDGAAFEQRVTDMAHSVCPDDPRPMKERRNDALAAIAIGTSLRCECANPDCPAADQERPTKDVIIHVITTNDTLTDAQNGEAEAEVPVGPAVDPAEDEPDSTPPDADPGNTTDAECRPVETEPLADAPVQDDSADAAGEASPATSHAPAFVFGASVLSPLVLPAFLNRAKIRQLTHPGDAPPEPRHRPSTALDDFVRCRDLTCRFPGCDVSAYRCDVDHTVPYPAGPTCASNLKCLCRKHHLLKTFWAGIGGWHDEQLPDGTVIWTSPSGQTYTTQPGSALLFPTLCIPTAPAPATTATKRTANSGLKMPRRSRSRAKDRAYRIEIERRLNDDLVAERNEPPPF